MREGISLRATILMIFLSLTAVSRADSLNQYLRSLSFSGYEWKVRKQERPGLPSVVPYVGPYFGLGNLFSDSEDAVFVDSAGRLHLRMRKVNGQWMGSEVKLTKALGYGTYRFYVDGEAQNLDPNLVFGMFTWSDGRDLWQPGREFMAFHRELDIELSRWGHSDAPNAQFVIQPFVRPHARRRFYFPNDVRSSLHTIDWQPGRALFRSEVLDAENSRGFTHESVYKSGVHNARKAVIRINLWHLGDPHQDAEVIVNRFDFENGASGL